MFRLFRTVPDGRFCTVPAGGYCVGYSWKSTAFGLSRDSTLAWLTRVLPDSEGLHLRDGSAMKQHIGSNKRVTLADVADRAGVSRALVSIVMREVPGASSETRARVLRIAEDLGYRPDARARMLAQQRSKLIGVVFGVTGTFHFHMLDALYLAAEEQGYELILSALTPGRGEKRAIDNLLGFKLGALIMLGPHTSKPLMAGKLPVVTVGWQVAAASVDVVRTSDENGMDRAVGHLVEMGHRNIWHLDGGETLVSRARSASYAKAMTSHGLGGLTRVVSGGEDQLDGSKAARDLLAEDILPTAVIAFNDEEAVAFLEVMRQAGIGVPEQISIVGWDDSPAAQLPHIRLTSIRQDPGKMGRAAIGRAIERIEGHVPEQREIVFDPIIVVRDTTGPISRRFRT
jgi:DNA-binding LacI/PurR family transcriptional regulator